MSITDDDDNDNYRPIICRRQRRSAGGTGSNVDINKLTYHEKLGSYFSDAKNSNNMFRDQSKGITKQFICNVDSNAPPLETLTKVGEFVLRSPDTMGIMNKFNKSKYALVEETLILLVREGCIVAKSFCESNGIDYNDDDDDDDDDEEGEGEEGLEGEDVVMKVCQIQY